MTHWTGFLRRGLGMTFCLVAVAFSSTASGQESAKSKTVDAKSVPHKHTPIVLNSRPIVSRYDVALTRPRRVLFSKGITYVADFGSGTVISIAKNGKSRVIAEDLGEPAGLAIDSLGRLYVSTFASGMEKAGTIIRIARDRSAAVFATGLNGPTALAFDAQDNLYVAELTHNTISKVDRDGNVTTFVPNIAAPSGLLVDNKSGLLYVLSASEGSLYSVSSMTDGMVELTRVASGFSAPSGLVAGPARQMVVVDYGRRRLMSVTRKGAVKLFALVPRGTVAADFDRLGNLIIANSDDRSLVKVTSNLSIKCPHCGRRIPVRLRTTKSRKPTPPAPKSEAKPMPPVI